MSKEESFHRKLKNLIEKNAILQKKIKDYELGIKDERTVIIYQMNELNVKIIDKQKAVGTKLGLFSDYSLTQEMFHNEIVAHENLKDLMEKFEEMYLLPKKDKSKN